VLLLPLSPSLPTQRKKPSFQPKLLMQCLSSAVEKSASPRPNQTAYLTKAPREKRDITHPLHPGSSYVHT
jgi:hypothetical protein